MAYRTTRAHDSARGLCLGEGGEGSASEKVGRLSEVPTEFSQNLGRPRRIEHRGQRIEQLQTLVDRVMLWTRCERETTVAWTVARDQALRDIVARGEAAAEQKDDFTVRVDVAGLDPARNY